MLRLEIAGNWEPQDFIEVLQSLESMYYKISPSVVGLRRGPYSYVEHLYYLEGDFGRERSFEGTLDFVNLKLLERARYETPQLERLSVKRIEYASPRWH